jgi:hypothetical protein
MSVAVEEKVESRTRPLVPTDVCDRCPASAQKIARSADEKELFFCTHHSNQYLDSLIDQGFYMDIETLDLR